jgi:crotonobetainyl-CoA:carnitine CoA-transferase CaiB-like acyl-CoA transferase
MESKPAVDYSASPGALQGFRVLELSTVIMGPYGAQILGDLGADVIKVETGEGDSNRDMGGGPHKELGGIALNINRNKRAVSLDLKAPAGRAAFLRILDTCDVLVTNIRPGPLARLRLTYEDVSPGRPGLVFCQAQGFRSGTAEENRPAYDDIIQAATGLPRLTEITTGKTAFLPSLIADKVAGPDDRPGRAGRSSVSRANWKRPANRGPDVRRGLCLCPGRALVPGSGPGPARGLQPDHDDDARAAPDA